MAYVTTDDGVRLFVEETGTGFPILFVHEFAGDHRSWEPQLRRFSRQYRCVSYAARGYPPSGVPADASAYSQQRAVADAIAVLDGLGIERAHIVGLSMGGFCTLHLGLDHPERAASLVVAGVGYGAAPDKRAGFAAECEKVAEAYTETGARAVAEWYARGPSRVQFQNKDPRGWAEFHERLAEHDPLGARLTMLGVQRLRPSLYELTDRLAELRVPTLVLTGDEDDGCLEPALLLKRTIPTAGLRVLERTGHTANLEEPDSFNAALADFLAAVESGSWRARDPRATVGATMLRER
ncbi:alpha/beta fold hydrolase [Sciscionella sediminilitoris]|uniref:alpha/beta fold hydrolase n=1 Tax=Sciscionella sediminilitoris TaxID=1445613 RepID=UPI0004DFC488|nr:alpha/beta hydrolase [Sciscionella sp. SE31]